MVDVELVVAEADTPVPRHSRFCRVSDGNVLRKL